MSWPEIVSRSLYADSEKPWRYELVQPVTWRLSNGDVITVPSGFRTDFASVPRLLRGVVHMTGNHNLATLIHDYLYDTRYGMEQGMSEHQARQFADREMLRWLLEIGCSRAKAYAMYCAVRIGGKRWFREEE